MQPVTRPLTLGRCLLAGLLTGLIAALIVVIYNVVYRGAADLIAYAVVMPVSIFAAFPLMNLVAGGIYYLFTGHWRNGRSTYLSTVLVVTAAIVVLTLFGSHPTDRDAEKFKGLLVGLEVIEGLLAAFLLPFFANHPRLFMTDKDIRGEE